ncbi:hypothetical protein BPAE_0049g00190 [Botrytis paeoniae]|uniref:Uncharacterized protein n=1 Tax=Botrytis paeoniae TaxID=278948 RepID=A0A4Z1FVG0_9HELO|nr:hypothetical protein BPAE_0049g00190 [Botrytis paeoniae]
MSFFYVALLKIGGLVYNSGASGNALTQARRRMRIVYGKMWGHKESGGIELAKLSRRIIRKHEPSEADDAGVYTDLFKFDMH